ncbi:ABC transporter substrate-binding protein [Streptomyces collinus]|uniref:ABC transporter substrate-binding protein n=1 Tax=Streptomyces collinus TaxID=42684 RepID=UPI003824B580
MNRKALVVPAIAGVVIAVAAVYDGFSPAGRGRDVIIVGTTDRFAVSGDVPAPVDPAYAYDVGSWNLLRQTVQTLMVQRGDGMPEPEAAQNCGFTDTGNERYVCMLREGLKFSNGDPVTAADVKFSIDRARSLQASSGVFALLSTIDTVETLGDHQVVFHLKTADATFPFKLSTPVAGIVNSRDYEKDRLRKGFAIDGSGPYTIRAEVKDNVVVKATFTKNPHYQGLLTPKNDEVVLESFPDADSMGAALDQGGIDVMTRTMSPEQILSLQNSSGSHVRLVEMPGLEIRYLGFNTDAPTVRSKAVRQAMAQVIDRSALVAKAYGSVAQPLYSLVPATLTGHTNSFLHAYGEPSVAEARTLLTEAGVNAPVKLTLHYTSDHYGPATKEEFEVLKEQLNGTGLFNVSIQGHPWEKFVPDVRKGEYDVYGMGWFPDFPDADNYLAPFLDKDNVLNSPYNNSKIRNTLIPQSRREADRLNAWKSLAGIQDIVADDVPVLPLWQGKQYLAASDAITGSVYAMNSSSALQLWELGAGVGD